MQSPPLNLQVELEFPNKQHQDGMVYTFTAVAWNEFGHSKPSPAKAFKTPRRPDPPVIDLVELLPQVDGEPYGSLAVTVTDPLDSGFNGEQGAPDWQEACGWLWRNLCAARRSVPGADAPCSRLCALPATHRHLAVHSLALL